MCSTAAVIDISDAGAISAPPAKRQRSNNSAFPQHLTQFVPPTVTSLLTNTGANGTETEVKSIHDSYTYLSKVPSEIAANPGQPVVMGIDEAGRGPVLGPMVYSLGYCLKKNLHILNENDFDDSKKLTDLKRTELLYAICTPSEGLKFGDEHHVTPVQKSLYPNIGYGITNLTARDISSEMLNSENFNNLNNQAHETTIALIRKVLTLLAPYNSPVTEVYIDTVGPPVAYQEKLQKLFPTLRVTVSKKADSLFPIVSAASVVAKVTRDIILKKYNELEDAYCIRQGLDPNPYGSGYPSDPRTTAWLNHRINDTFGWDQVVRYSWQTTKTLLNNKSKVAVVWEDDIRTKKIDYGNEAAVSSFFKKEDRTLLTNLDVSTLWYGQNVASI